jgi:hypothetical protein
MELCGVNIVSNENIKELLHTRGGHDLGLRTLMERSE